MLFCQFILLIPEFLEYDLFFVPANSLCRKTLSVLHWNRAAALLYSSVCCQDRSNTSILLRIKHILKDLYKFSQVLSDIQKNVNKSVPRRHSAKNSRERCREVLSKIRQDQGYPYQEQVSSSQLYTCRKIIINS